MSKIDKIDSASLRARLAFGLERFDDAGFRGASLYLWAIGACFLACSDDEEEERLEELFYGQAREEGVDGDTLLNAIVMASDGGAKK